MKNLKLIKFISLSAFLLLLTFPLLGLAQPSDPTMPITSVQGIYDLIMKIMRWIFTLLLVVAVIFIFIAAFSYLTAGGDPEKLGKAKNQLIYAIVAIAIALVARGIEFIVRDILGA